MRATLRTPPRRWDAGIEGKILEGETEFVELREVLEAEPRGKIHRGFISVCAKDVWGRR
jgi:hypothetical protein